MPSRTSTPSPESPHSSGLKDEVTSFAKGASDYLSARSELVAIEVREAGVVYKKRLVRIAIAVFTLLLAYLLFLIAAVYYLGEFLEKQLNGPLAGWHGAALALGGLHLIIGIIFLFRYRKGPTTPLFEYTRSEWQKDQQWLSQKTKSEN